MPGENSNNITIRKPTLQDGEAIFALIESYAGKGLLLAKTIRQISESLRDFSVCEYDGKIVGCCALHLWSDLTEIRSLAVEKEYNGQGIGTALVNACLTEARDLGVEKIFLLTYKATFFQRFGFNEVDKGQFPQKIWTDCAQCAQFPNCNETALIMHLNDNQGT